MPDDKEPKEHRAVIEQARELAAGMENYKQPTCCARCFELLLTYIAQPEASAELNAVRRFCHPFWRAGMVLLTTPRNDEELSSLNQLLSSNSKRCPRAADWHNSFPRRVFGDFDNPLPMMIKLFYLLFTTAIQSGIGSKKRYTSKGVLWPVHPNDLVPLGPYETIVAHLTWCCRLFPYHSQAIYYLGCAMTVCRAHVLPHLFDSPLQERVLWCLTTLLDRSPDSAGSVASSPWPWPGSSGPLAPLDFIKSQISSYSPASLDLQSVSIFVGELLWGPDFVMDDVLRLTYGYQAVLLSAVRTARRRADSADDAITRNAYDVLDRLAFQLELFVRMTDSGPNLASLSSQIPLLRLVDDHTRLYHSLRGCYRRRHCFGPTCGKAVHEAASARAFSQCSRCRFTQYCSKECQREDWKRGTAAVPHKEMCPILGAVLDVIRATYNAESFRTLCPSVGIDSGEPFNRVSLWASTVMSRGVDQSAYEVIVRS